MLKVDIADNAYDQEQGLMFVEHLPEDRGMMFRFKRPQRISFWGRNTFIPLDIAFVDDDMRVTKISQISPHSLSTVSSDKPCIIAVEANQGFFESNNVKLGDKIQLEYSKEHLPAITSQQTDWCGAFLTFKSGKDEGITPNPPKDNLSGSLKMSQIGPQPIEPVEKVVPADQKTVGKPITEQVDGQILPVVSVEDLGGILEDSLGDTEETDQNQSVPDNGQPLSTETIDQPVEENFEEPLAEEIPDQEVEEIEEDVDEPKEEFPVFSNAFEAINWAEQNSQVVRIEYTTKHGNLLVREVEPHGKFHSDTSHREVLVCFDETIGDIRAFIIGNISRWAFVGRKFNKKFVVRA